MADERDESARESPPPEEPIRPATAADIAFVLALLERLRAALAALGSRLPANRGGTAVLPEQLVTLDQIAAMVHRSKRSLERYRKRMPAPRVRGRRGRPHLWAWAEVRPWLEATFDLRLPEQFPARLS
jgi:hypothetical protein